MVQHQNITLILAFSLLCSLFAACMPEIEGNEKETYFSTKTYFQRVIDDMADTTIILQKEAEINGVKEASTFTVERDSIFWQQEFQAFIEADINKPALVGQYRVDTLVTRDEVTGKKALKITYTALAEDLRTRSLIIWIRSDNRDVLGLQLETADKNVIYASGQTLRYRSGSSYQIDAHQEVVSQDRETYTLTSTFQYL